MTKGYLMQRHKDCFGRVETFYRPVPAWPLFILRRRLRSRSGDQMLKRKDAIEFGIGMVGKRRFLSKLYRGSQHDDHTRRHLGA